VEVEPQVERVQQLQEMVAVAPNHQALVSIQVQESKLVLVEQRLNMVVVEMVITPLVLQELQDQVRALLEHQH
jgi:hypothetical protein